jgi:hypothetical protein
LQSNISDFRIPASEFFSYSFVEFFSVSIKSSVEGGKEFDVAGLVVTGGLEEVVAEGPASDRADDV